MKNQNNGLQSSNIFSKLKSLIYYIFHKKQTEEFSLEKEEYEDLQSNEVKYATKINNFYEEYKLKNERRNYILNLQRKYKAKEIFEKDMSEEDRIELENLYVEQNNELMRKIKEIDLKIKD